MSRRDRDAFVREVREGDVEELVANLRPADRDECAALIGEGREAEGIRNSVRLSTHLWAGEAEGRVAAIFGVVPVSLLGGQGAPWLMGTPLIDRHRGAFIRLNRTYIPQMLDTYPHLVNIVDARNVRSIAWLKRLGFEVHAPLPLGVAGRPFHLFTMGG
jgi:hypothetical protein